MLKRTIELDIAELGNQPIKYIHDLWAAYFDTPPPTHNKRTLINKLAYRLQEIEYGGLKPKTIKELLKYNEQNPKRKRKKPELVAGTTLIREYNDETHEVVVTINGYVYKGKIYNSLSAVATVITGTNRNGVTFFGIRK